ncbi:hypothetical protein [Neptunomonas qingdaonensis]|uniref:Uncharacterized protein n=1 Tax=Neptunomonas qingdaonensis TaxID=1045558 RepID=A0A1I2SLL4_9GAMM|nr:hypothetical protein [Neptunomonas qingdaonensis]SFG53423.1 hypothetical protein SAMN05216175_10863 [Neptunomonas qingdaonensis]
MNNNKILISQYIKAKDNNKPHLMKRVFSQHATLEMSVQTDNISFPAKVTGLDNITQTLVCEFNTTYENIYTLCLTDTVQQNQNQLNCRWIVCMTEKTSGSLRLGYGDYQWGFEKNVPCLANHLVITIEHMVILPQALQPDVLSWFDKLPYPWALSSELQATMPDVKLLSDSLVALYQ